MSLGQTEKREYRNQTAMRPLTQRDYLKEVEKEAREKENARLAYEKFEREKRQAQKVGEYKAKASNLGQIVGNSLRERLNRAVTERRTSPRTTRAPIPRVFVPAKQQSVHLMNGKGNPNLFTGGFGNGIKRRSRMF